MNIVTISDKRYPRLLKEIGKDAPKQLYYKGKWDDIFSAQGGPASGGENCLAVVGSRRLTSYGRQVTEMLVTEAAAAGIIVVSGFMYGGDAAAHKAAVKAGGRTIAVMPCGIDRIHPEDQEDLYFEILNNRGLVISEYEGDMLPSNWTYPRRNRIVAGLSKAVLVVEAGIKSGSLITANLAKKFGRKVFAVPGPITSEVSKGTLQLLKEGAEMATGVAEILRFYGVRRSLSEGGCQKKMVGEVDGLEGKVLEYLQRESLGIDDLARTLGVSASKLGAIISLMQLKGLIEQEGNKFYVGKS